jgi:hypothetical protein
MQSRLDRPSDDAAETNPRSEPAGVHPEVIGTVDVVTDQWVLGWIANTADPDCLEPVVALAPNGDRLSFLPFVPRLDVSTALGVPGRYGFAIPVTALRVLGPVVRLVNQAGSALRHGDAVALPPQRSSAGPQSWVFLHIPKTAGTSIRNALTAAVPPGEFLFIYKDGHSGLRPSEIAALPERQRAAIRLMFGHMGFGTGAHLPNAAGYVTFLRDTESRLRSNYRHHRDRDSRFTANGDVLPLETVASQGLAEEFDNIAVRLLAGLSADEVPQDSVGEHHVDMALSNLRTSFRFIGLVDRADEHYPALCHALGIAGRPLGHDNVCAETPGTGDDGVDWAAILHRNRFDTALYERVIAEGLAGRALDPGQQA